MLSKNIFIYIVLWAFPPYSSVSAFSIHTVGFLCTLGRFPFTFMPYMYSCFISVYILRGQFRLLYGWWGIRIIFLPAPSFFLLPTTSLNILLANTSQVPSLFLAPSFRAPQPVWCTPLATDLFCTLFWWFSLFGDYMFLFVWVFSDYELLREVDSLSTREQGVTPNVSSEAHVEVLCSNPDLTSRRWVHGLALWTIA